jgi:hypothetical protein
MIHNPGSEFSREEMAVLGKLKRPEEIQRFLDDLGYNKEKGGATCRSPRRVLRDRTAHCMEGALLGAAALRVHGHQPLLLDLEGEQDSDHVLAIFRERGCWGAVAKSNFSGLRFRTPVYRTIRELVMSYFEHYFNLRGDKSLRRHSQPVNLKRFDRIHWMTAEEDVWAVPEYLVTIPHRPVVTPEQVREFKRLDRRLFEAGVLGHVK